MFESGCFPRESGRFLMWFMGMNQTWRRSDFNVVYETSLRFLNVLVFWNQT